MVSKSEATDVEFAQLPRVTEWLTINQAAALLGVSRQTMYSRLPSLKTLSVLGATDNTKGTLVMKTTEITELFNV
jgi:hypothetical protein